MGLAMAIMSFRLSEERIEKYNKILAKLRIDGDTASDRFRNLIDYLYEYFEDINPPFQTAPDFESGSTSERINVLDLVINALIQHEKNLDGITQRLERVSKVEMANAMEERST